MERIAVGTEDLHTVCARRECPAGRSDEALRTSCASAVLSASGTGKGCSPLSVNTFPWMAMTVAVPNAPATVDVGVIGTAGVHDLHHDAATAGVHSVGHPPPAGLVLVGDDARHTDPSLRCVADVGALGDNQPDTGPLPVVLDHQVPGDAGGTGPHPGQRRHDDAVGELGSSRERPGRKAKERNWPQTQVSFCDEVDNGGEPLPVPSQ